MFNWLIPFVGQNDLVNISWKISVRHHFFIFVSRMMTFNISGCLLFALATTITPGPNNYLLLCYGKNYGIKESVRLMAGIFLGFHTMLMVAGYGVAGIVAANPTLELALKVVSSVWLLLLALALCRSNSQTNIDQVLKLGFSEGFLMQFINPKAWIMAISGASAFLPKLGNIHLNVFVFAGVFNLVGIPSMLAWVFSGQQISKILQTPRAHQLFGVVLFLLMAASIVFMWL